MQDMAFISSLMRSALLSVVSIVPIVPIISFVSSAAKSTIVAAVVPVNVPDKAKEGIFNLVLSKANVKTSLLARLCIAICNLYS